MGLWGFGVAMTFVLGGGGAEIVLTAHLVFLDLGGNMSFVAAR